MNRVGFALIGLGSISEVHARAINSLDNGYLRGVLSRSKEKGKEFSMRHGDPVVYDDVEDLLNDSEVDVVVITTPSSLHMDYALMAISHHKSVISEKPLEITSDRAERIVKAARDQGVFLTTVFQSRFMEATKRVKRAYDEGRFGRISVVEASVLWNRSPSYYRAAPWRGTIGMDGGGVIMNQGIHTVDLMLYILGEWKRVYAMKKNIVHDIEGEDTIVGSIEFSNGALGTLSATTAAYPERPRVLRICGENGSATIEDDWIAEWEFKERRDEDDEIERLFSNRNAKDFKSKEEYFAMLYKDFIGSLETGRTPLITPSSSLESIRLIEALYKSAEGSVEVFNDRASGSAL